MTNRKTLARWSTDNWHCDVLIHERDAGWLTHVAKYRLADPIPEVDDQAPSHEWHVQAEARVAALTTSERVPIGGCCDGMTFLDGDLDLLHDRLVMLKGAGYRIPDRLLTSTQGAVSAERE